MKGPIDYSQFQRKLPYASQLFGVYQPLIGWKGAQALRRAAQEQRSLTSYLTARMYVDSGVRRQLAGQFDIPGPGSPSVGRLPAWLMTPIAAEVQAKAAAIQSERGMVRPQDWLGLVQAAIDKAADRYKSESRLQGAPIPGIDASLFHASDLTPQQMSALNAQPVPGTDFVLATPPQAMDSPTHESVVAGVLAHLAREAPSVLESLLIKPKPRWDRVVSFLDPLAAFSTPRGTEQEVLTPIGVLHIFRQYFFDFKAFLGPAVEHIWLSPGSVLEVFEIRRRRTTTERLFERITETLTRSEVETIDRDEISDAMRDENDSNTSMGASVSAGVGMGIWHAEGSFNYQDARSSRVAQETTHRHMHQQTERLTNEIRRSFKTSFRTTTEVDDETSRRHVIQNTSNELVNYELRRKIRAVGVQVRHLSTQLCWQVYLNRTGDDLGIGELVHVARPDDMHGDLEPPAAPQSLPSKETELKVEFPFSPLTDDNDDEDDYWQGKHDDSRIVWQKTFRGTPPAPGYVLADVQESSPTRAYDTDEGSPTVDASYDAPLEGTTDQFRINLNFVNFNSHRTLTFDLKLIWDPDEALRAAANAEFQKKWAEYTEERRRLAHAAFVEAVRERIKLASNIVPRDPASLRLEEHGCIMGRLVAQLAGTVTVAVPVISELISKLFDLDQMLYFVAPDWWTPRRHYRQEVGQEPILRLPMPGAGSPVTTPTPQGEGEPTRAGGTHIATPPGQPTAAALPTRPGVRPPARDGITDSQAPPSPLSNSDLVGWGGIEEAQRDNYLITEDSVPAPLGASIGWLIQLDGDDRRNAFLNSPWVKAVIPIRMGKEMDAVTWLQQSQTEYIEGLDGPYKGDPIQMPDGRVVTPSTFGDAIVKIAQALQAENQDPIKRQIDGELVFENGFSEINEDDRLAGKPYTAFDQFAFTVHTNQLVAQEFKDGED